MKNSKMFRKVLSVALAASLVCGCVAFTGCDKKEDTKETKVEETEAEETKAKETEAEETEAEETEAEETEAEETEAEETEAEETDVVIDFEETEVESDTADDFEDEDVKALAQKYIDDGYAIKKMDAEDGISEEYADAFVEGFLAGRPDEEVSLSVSAGTDEEGSASGYGAIDEIVVAKFSSAETAEKMLAEMGDEESLKEQFGETCVITDTDDAYNLTAGDKAEGMYYYMNLDKTTNIVEMEVFMDLDVLFNAMSESMEDVEVVEVVEE